MRPGISLGLRNYWAAEPQLRGLKGLPCLFRLLGVHRLLDQLEGGADARAIPVRNEGGSGNDQVHDAHLEHRLRICGLQGLRHAFAAVRDGNQDVFQAARHQCVTVRHSIACAFVYGHPNAQHVTATVGDDAQRNVHRHRLDDNPAHRTLTQNGSKMPPGTYSRAGTQPVLDATSHCAHEPARRVTRAGHRRCWPAPTARVHGDSLLIEAAKSAGVPEQQNRLQPTRAISSNVDVQVDLACVNRLAPVALGSLAASFASTAFGSCGWTEALSRLVCISH